MGGKKTCEKSREWEKERRDKLNVGFSDLCKLLPDHDPSMSLSKMDILRKAAEYIRQLQDQNEEIVKSGKDNVLKNEAERLRKRVAYLVLKTKDLVGALKAAGVPIPNKKKKKFKIDSKTCVEKDRHGIPSTTVVDPVQHISYRATGKQLINGISFSPMNDSSSKKIEHGCDKVSRKKPLSEVKGTSSNTLLVPDLRSNVTVVACSSQSHTTILNGLNPSLLPVNIENASLTSTLGAGTLIFRDGRVITVPPPTSLIPQVLVKPQPAVILMQKAHVAHGVKRDKYPLIFPKRDITQTTYTNKAPIPAIKTFRLESLQKTSKSSKTKKKKDTKAESININSVPPSKFNVGRIEDQCSGIVKSCSNPTAAVGDLTSVSHSPLINSRKRKAEASTEISKLNKSDGTVAVASIDKDGEVVPEKLPKNDLIVRTNNLKKTSSEVELICSTKSPVTSCVDSSEITLASSKVTLSSVTSKGNDCTLTSHEIMIETGAQNIHSSSVQKHPTVSEIGSCGETDGSSVEGTGVKVVKQPTLNTSLNPFGMNHSREEDCTPSVSPRIPKLAPLSNGASLKGGLLLPLSEPTDATSVEKINSSTEELETETIQSNTECQESRNNGLCESKNVGSNEIAKSFDSQGVCLNKSELFTGKDGHDFEGHSTEINIKFKISESNSCHDPDIKMYSETSESVKEKATKETEEVHMTPTEPEKLPSHPTISSFQKTNADKSPISEGSSLVQSVGCTVVNNQYDLHISGSVNPEQMFSFDDSVHDHLDPYHDEISKTQSAAYSVECNNSSDVADVLTISDLDLDKKNNLTTKGKSSKSIDDNTSGCSDAVHHKLITSHDNTSSKLSSPNSKELVVEKSNNNNDNSNNEIGGTADTLHRCVKSSYFKNNQSDDNNLQSTNNFISGTDSHKSSLNMLSFQNQAKVSLIDTVPSSAITSGSQTYPIAISEQSRTESFLKYDNPIVSLPSADPFFSNFVGKASDMGSMSYTSTPTTCFSYTNFTTQAPPVRSVAHQLFPADTLCSIANSYNLLNTRQSELESNLPQPSGANTQIFQFSSYSSAGSYRDPALIANDSVTTLTKTNATIGSLGNFSQTNKGTSALHYTHNYTDILHSTPNMNCYSTLSCNSVAMSSSSCLPLDIDPITSTQSKLSHKQFATPESRSVLIEDHSKINRKSNSNDANSSMNLITSSTASKSEMKTQGPYVVTESTVHQKPINSESSHNSNSNYFNPAPQMTQDVGYNLYTRDSIHLSKNTRSTQHMSSNNTINLDKSFQKTSNHAVANHKSAITKEFNMTNITNSVAQSVENTRGSVGRFSVESNLFQNTCNQFPEHSTKVSHGQTLASNSMLNFHGGGSTQLPSNHQSVQTQQSYLGNTSDPQGFLTTKNYNHIATSVNQSFAGPTQSSNRNNQVVQSDKYSRVSGSLYPVKLRGGDPENDTSVTECTVPSHNSQESYQTVSSSVQNPTTISLQSSQVVFSSTHVFSHPNFSAHHSSLRGPKFSSYTNGPRSISSKTIYTNPTTVLSSNQDYLHGPNTSPGDAVHRGNSRDILHLNNLNKNTPALTSQLPNPGNLPSSPTGQFSTVDSLDHNSHNIGRINNENQISSTVGNQILLTSRSQATVNPSNGNFTGIINPSLSINVSTNHKSSSIQNDRMSNFTMSNIASYSQNASLPNVNNPHVISKGLHSSDQNYSNVQTPSQNLPVNKLLTNYSPATTNHPSSAKQCDYPMSTILPGLNDPILSGNSLNNDGNSIHLNKNLLSGMTGKSSECTEKTVDKQYSTNTEGSSFKTTVNCGTDYLRNKDNERNSFIPIIEDVRLNSEFSNDLFSSLQVPTGGAHSDSISPTAAFLLAFPLVSTSKNTENPHEQDPVDNNTSTPTTILQIGNIEPPNSEIFHPLEFGKDMEPSDYLRHDQDKCKRKENISQGKHKKQATSNVCPQTYNYSGISSDYSVGHYDQTWSEHPNKNKAITERKKSEKMPKPFNNNNNAFEFCKQDKKKKNKISVNWMAAPEANDSFQKEVELSSFPIANLPFPIDIDGLNDLCSTKKNNSSIYSWSPSKSLLPIDNGLLIPSTLPTLVGDLALGTTTPSDPFSKRCDNKKALDKQLEKSPNSQKTHNNFLSVSQLVDPKSKKQKQTENKCKKTEKKKTAPFTKRKDTNEPCMYPDSFLPPLGWDKYRYKNNYSAEALIGSQDINESVNFYQQNPNYFMGTDFGQEHHSQSQQYQNSFSFSQNQFSSFVAEEYQNDNFSLNQIQGSSFKRVTGSDKQNERCRDEMSSRFVGNTSTNSSRCHHSSISQPYPPLPLPSTSTASSLSSNFTSNTTTSVTNFNLSTIFPEINERTGSQGQQNVASQQQSQHQHHIQQHTRNTINSFPNNTNNSYRSHNI